MNEGRRFKSKSFAAAWAIVRSRIDSRRVQAAYGMLFLICLIMWRGYSSDIDLYNALYGFSPLDWVNQIVLPENYAKNFPSGVENYKSSAFMYIYPWAFEYLKISPEALNPYIILLEISALAGAVFYLCRTLKPEAGFVVPFLVVLSVISGHTGEMNLARFETTFYKGLFYNVADAMRIVSIALFFNKKFIGSFICVSFSFVTHLVIGFIGIAFLFAMLIPNIREVPKRQLAIGLIFCGIICIGWLLASFNLAGLDNGGIPAQIWVELTKLNNFHWYPVEYGIFTFNHQERFLPFLSFILIFSFYFNRFPVNPDIRMKVISGMLAMVGLVLIGVIASTLTFPALIKLSLHRASDLIIHIGLIYVVDGLFMELKSNLIYRLVLSVLILLSPFMIKPAFPLVYSFLLTVPPTLATILAKRGNSQARFMFALQLAIAVLCIYYIGEGSLKPWNANAYTGLVSFRNSIPALLVIAGVMIGRIRGLNISQAIIACAMLILSFNWVFHHQMRFEEKQLARAYKEAQLWAQKNTFHDALFMIDPTIYYGWRDYAQRSSFGNLRDWLHSPCGYQSNYSLHREGMKRFEEFGIPLQHYLQMRPPLRGFEKLNQEVERRFYASDDLWKRELAKRYGVQYFVMMKKKMINSINLPIVYENDSFIIYST